MTPTQQEAIQNAIEALEDALLISDERAVAYQNKLLMASSGLRRALKSKKEGAK